MNTTEPDRPGPEPSADPVDLAEAAEAAETAEPRPTTWQLMSVQVLPLVAASFLARASDARFDLVWWCCLALYVLGVALTVALVLEVVRRRARHPYLLALPLAMVVLVGLRLTGIADPG